MLSYGLPGATHEAVEALQHLDPVTLEPGGPEPGDLALVAATADASSNASLVA